MHELFHSDVCMVKVEHILLYYDVNMSCLERIAVHYIDYKHSGKHSQQELNCTISRLITVKSCIMVWHFSEVNFLKAQACRVTVKR